MDSAGTATQMTEFYSVPHFARVRKESFGLLFYNTADNTMTFVRSGNLLEIVHSPKGSKIAVFCRESPSRKRIEKLLDRLRKKGLIVDS
jgi:putative mycofactocin binding protein MftB